MCMRAVNRSTMVPARKTSRDGPIASTTTATHNNTTDADTCKPIISHKLSPTLRTHHSKYKRGRTYDTANNNAQAKPKHSENPCVFFCYEKSTLWKCFDNLAVTTDIGLRKSSSENFSRTPQHNHYQQHIPLDKLTGGYRKRLSGFEPETKMTPKSPKCVLAFFRLRRPRPRRVLRKAGGKPSTWLPPGGLADRFHMRKLTRNKNKKHKKNNKNKKQTKASTNAINI